MQIPIEQELDPFVALRWENILDDINDAHNKLETHLELSDEWLHDFEGRMGTHAKLAMSMYHTIIDLKQTVETQQKQIEELQAAIGFSNTPIIISLDQTSAKI
jgi:type II secretory pathway component PulJ